MKSEVGIRELHDQLSDASATHRHHHLAAIRDMADIRLAPVSVEDPLADLRERGLIQEPQREWQPRRRGRPSPSAPVSDLVAEQRR